MGAVFKHTSIARKLSVFLAVMLTLQCALFAGFILLGGTMNHLDQSALSSFSQQVSVQKDYLENEMVRRWSNLDRTQALIGASVSDFLAKNEMTTRDLTPTHPGTAQLLEDLSEPLLSLLRTNSVTGVFLIFKGASSASAPAPGMAYLQSGLCFRNPDPSTSPADNSDLTVVHSSSDLFRNLDLVMDVNWMPVFQISEDSLFFYEPMGAATAHAGTSTQNLGYWSPPHTLSGDNVSLISYSEPLLDSSGKPYGVLGVEMSTDYLHRLLPSAKLTSESSAYILAGLLQDETLYRSLVSSGTTARKILTADKKCYLIPEPIQESIYTVDPEYSTAEDKVYASVHPFMLYNEASPFFGETWALIGLIERSSLFSLSLSTAKGILGLALATIVLGIFLSIFTGNILTRPIRVLAQTVRSLDPYSPVSLPPVHFQEIDELSASIVRLSESVSAAASRTTRIIELSKIPLAAFELDKTLKTPIYTKNFFSLLGLPEPVTPPTLQGFRDTLKGLAPYHEADNSKQTLFRLPSQDGYRWIRLQTVEQDGGVLGVLSDVTAEIEEKRRLEYERDYDLLTNLLNRRAFWARIKKLEEKPDSMRTAAMLMMDLDNLKYLNDTYGHDCGDEYIRCAANVLRSFTVLGGLAARVSGDEFYLFLSGYDDRKVLQHAIQRLQDAIAEAYILIPTGQRHRLRASLGVAWYPEDSRSLSELARFADFAMYTAKKETKGGSRDFNMTTYRRDAFLLYSQEELNRILDERAVDYAFQPIVSCADGSVLGYEALMRPRSKTLSSPLDLLRVARVQSKLLHVEKLTRFRAMESFSTLSQGAEGYMVFLNSISSQVLSGEDLELFLEMFGPYLGRVVIEFTEGDEQNSEATAIKRALCRQHGIRLALDDYGTGYSGDGVLLSLHPDFVKVDMSIIQGIDQDKTRQAVLRNLVSLCRDLGIKTIAEGVETGAELRTVVCLGADYIQGYYTGQPTFSLGPIAPERVAEICSIERQGDAHG